MTLRAAALETVARKWCGYHRFPRIDGLGCNRCDDIAYALREVVERCVEIVGGDEGGEGVDTGRIWRNTMRHQIIATIRGEFGE